MILMIISWSLLQAQESTGVIKGRVYNSKTNEGVPFATVVIWGTTTGAVTDFEGNFVLSGIDPGFVLLRASSIGYKPFISSSVVVTDSNQVNLEIPLEETEIDIEEVVLMRTGSISITLTLFNRLTSFQELFLHRKAML